ATDLTPRPPSPRGKGEGRLPRCRGANLTPRPPSPRGKGEWRPYLTFRLPSLRGTGAKRGPLMRHPLELLAPAYRRPVFLVGLVLTLGVMLALNVLGAALITPAAPLGIVSFE